MRDILKYVRNLWQPVFGPQQIIVHLVQSRVWEMVPPEFQRNTRSVVASAHVLASPYSRAGAFTNCLPSVHLLHL